MTSTRDIGLLQNVLAHIVAAENEVTPEAQKRAIDFIRDNHLPYMMFMSCTDEMLIENPEKYVLGWKRVYEKVKKTLDCLIVDKIKEDAWYVMHPKREPTEEEQKEIDACEHTIFMYEVIDRPMWQDEPLRKSADRARQRILEIKKVYRGGVNIL